MQIQYLEIEQIKPYAYNPRNNKKAIPFVVQSIMDFGFKNPIILDKNKTIICGHTRYLAAKELGMTEVPCIIADELTPAQVKAFRLADNKVAEKAEWDEDLLMDEINDILGLDFDISGLGFDEIKELEPEKEVVDDEFDVDIAMPEEPKSKPGEIYQLGKHRLMCGDSTNMEDVAKLMDGKKADLLFTDPPYNVNVQNSQGMTIENDNMESSKFRQFLDDAFKCASSNLKDGGAFYIWHADSETVNFRETAADNGLSTRQCLIWVKNSINFGRQDYKWQHEPCLYGWKEGAGHYFVEEYNHPTVIEDEIDIDAMKKEDLKAFVEELLKTSIKSTVIHEKKPLKNELHPTMKPLKMCGDLIRNSSREDELVLDLFGGSGSTLMVCEQLDRVCNMMEYDPKYVDVIITRWEEFTGNKAVKIN